MADVFISYVRDDIEKARMLADALTRNGWSVWWGAGILHGASLDDENKRELQAAPCVVVLWSRASIHQPLVIAETYYAMGRGTLLPVLLDDVKLPVRLGRARATSLADWDGDPLDPMFEGLVDAISRFVEPSPPAPRSAAKELVAPSVSVAPSVGGAPSLAVAAAPETAAVEFTVYHPRRISPDSWSTLLAYVHLPDVRAAIEADSKERLAREGAHEHESAEAMREIAREAEIRIVPELPGCQFNPPYMPVLWLEDWHRAEFRARASAAVPGFALGKAVNGRVAFYVESVLVGEAPLWALLSDKAGSSSEDEEGTDTASASAYRAVFASYSHHDTDVVEGLEKAYKALGMTFLRDVESLRSGEDWNAALLGMIEKADIFQLYWSETARKSRYVEQEWRYALAQRKANFIRPIYWRKPMPDPPGDLAHLHFAFLPRECS